MILHLFNTTNNPVAIEYFGRKRIIQPSGQEKIYFENTNINIKMFHTVSDRLNPWWYLAETIFSLSQMRTVLVVDGEYVFESESEETTIEISSQEYVFEKHTSYEVFTFAGECCVECVRLQVAQEDKIYRRAKFLYLFGGSKSLLLPCGMLLFVFLLIAIVFPNGSLWDWIEAGVCLICFLTLFVRYKKSLMFLKRVMREEVIFAYLVSSGINYGSKIFGD